MIAPILLVLCAAAAPEQPLRERTAPAASEAAGSPADLPVSVERVQRALSRPPAIRLAEERPVFRVEVLSRKLSIEDILGPDYLKGPVPGGGMTHQEFLDMVTPKEFRGYAAYSNREAMTIAATSLALKWALQKAVDRYRTASDARAREAARKEVEDALADLDRARLKAGLPPR